MDAVVGVPGVWTPPGEVICMTCHGQFMKWGRTGEVRGWASRDVERIPDDDEAVTTCEKCGRAICVIRHVADMRNLMLAVNAASWDDDAVPGLGLVQSGGMTCNIEGTFPDGRFVCIGDAEDDARPGAVGVGLYASQEWMSNGEDHIDCATVDDAAALLAKLREWAVR